MSKDEIAATAGVALYWDFENLHASVQDAEQGAGSFRAHRGPHEALVNVEAIMDYASGLGEIVVNQAYANWQWFGAYRSALLANGLDCVQLFPPGAHAKNGADIRLALDCMEDLGRLRSITHVVIVGGDSDFIPLARKIRRLGKSSVGLGVEASSNRFLIKAFSRFLFYRSLLARAGQLSRSEVDAIRETADLSAVRDLVRRGLQRLTSEAGETWALKARLKPALLQIDPSFDEANYGFQSINKMLLAFDDLVEQRVGEFDHELRLREEGAPRDALRGDAPSAPRAAPWSAAADAEWERYYRRALCKNKGRLFSPELLRACFQVAAQGQLERGSPYESFEALERDIEGRLDPALVTEDISVGKKARRILYALGALDGSPPGDRFWVRVGASASAFERWCLHQLSTRAAMNGAIDPDWWADRLGLQADERLLAVEWLTGAPPTPLGSDDDPWGGAEE